MILLTTFDFARPIIVNLDCVVKIETYTARATEEGKGSKEERTGSRLTTVNNVQGRTEEASRPIDVRETLDEIWTQINERFPDHFLPNKHLKREARGKGTSIKSNPQGIVGEHRKKI